MANKDILDEMGVDKLHAAARYYQKMKQMNTPVMLLRAANLFGVSPKMLAMELDRQGIRQVSVPVVMQTEEEKKKAGKKKTIAGSVPDGTNAGYSGTGGSTSSCATAGAAGGAAGGVGESEQAGHSFKNQFYTDVGDRVSTSLGSGTVVNIDSSHENPAKHRVRVELDTYWDKNDAQEKKKTFWFYPNEINGSLSESGTASTFSAKDINALSSLDTGTAKQRAEEIIRGNFSSTEKKRLQLRSLSKARKTTDIMALLYNILLAGEGLGTVKARGRKEEVMGESNDVHSFEYDVAMVKTPDGLTQFVNQLLKRLGYAPVSPEMYLTTARVLLSRAKKEPDNKKEMIGQLLWQAGQRLIDFENMPKKSASVPEAKATQGFAAGTGHANRVYGLSSDTKKLVAQNDFVVHMVYPGAGFSQAFEPATVHKGDIIWNLPGGIFIDGEDVRQVAAKTGSGTVNQKYGVSVSKNSHNTATIAKNAVDVQEEGILNKINGAKKKIKRKVNVSQRRPHEEFSHKKL